MDSINYQITAIILTKNEEKVLSTCLCALQFCNEIIVIDDYSTDKTVTIAKKYRTKVYKRHLNNDFASQRNFGLRKASNEWCLFVDADEVISKTLSKELLSAILDSRYSGFYLRRIDVFLNKELTGGDFVLPILRVGQKKAGKWNGRVHEIWNIRGQTKELHAPIFHNSHQSIQQFISQIVFHAKLHAKQKSQSQTHASFFQVVCYPAFKFMYTFFIKRGYRDGTHGFVANMMMSFHSFLSWSALWIEQH